MPQDAAVIDVLRAGRSMAEDAAVRRLMTFLFDYEQVRRPVRTLSGGERTRLAFLLLMEDAPNCLLLDEPTNHLDIDSIEVLENALEHYDGTVVAVSHDRYFLDRIADRKSWSSRWRRARLRGRLVGEVGARLSVQGWKAGTLMHGPLPQRTRQPDRPDKRTWLGTVKRTVSEFRDDNLTDWAAALTYYAVLSLFPAMIALISILGLVVDPATITRVITDVVSQLGPSSAVDTFKGPIEQIASNRSGAMLGLVIGVAAALWTASGYIGAFMRASNAIYEREEGRPFYILRPFQILVTLVLVMMAALVVLSLVVSGPVAEAIGSAVGLGDTAVMVWDIAKWPVMLVVVMVMLAVLYWSSPNAKPAGFRWVSPGSVLAVIVWIVASAAFAFYVGNFGSYNKTYGALAA